MTSRSPPRMPAERLEETRQRLAKMTVRCFCRGLSLALELAGDAERARDIGVPTLATWGNLDTGFIIEASKRLVGTIPNAQAAVIAECGHSPPYEAAAAVQRGAVCLLDRVPKRT